MNFLIYLPLIAIGIVFVSFVAVCIYVLLTHRTANNHIDDLGIVLSTNIINMFYYDATRRIVMQLRSGKTQSGTAVFVNGKLTGIKCDNGHEITRESIPREHIKHIERKEMLKVRNQKEVKKYA